MTSLPQKAKDFAEYYTQTAGGHTIRSSTTFLSDEKDNIIGAICINLDITEWLRFGNALGHIIGRREEESSGMTSEKFARKVQELMDHYLAEVEAKIGKPAAQMDKPEKLQALAYLDEKGVLQIAKAHVKLCEFFDISKFTLYNYLDEVRKKDEPGQ